MSIGTKKVKVGGKLYTYPRNYVSEYKQRSPRQKENRTVRRKARDKMEKKYGKSALAGKDVDHKKGIGGGNGYDNLRVTSVHFNRARKSKKWR